MIHSKTGTDRTAGEISKSEAKRQHKALQEFVRKLIDAPPGQIAQLGLPESIVEEIVSAGGMARSALKRQIGFIARKIVRELDVDSVDEVKIAFASLQIPAARANARFHRLEKWRDALISGDDRLINTLCEKHGADRQKLRRLVRQCRKETDTENAPKTSRNLFQYLKSLELSP